MNEAAVGLGLVKIAKSVYHHLFKRVNLGRRREMTDKKISGFLCNTPDEVKRFLDKYCSKIEVTNLELQLNHIINEHPENFLTLLEFADCSKIFNQFEKYSAEQQKRVEDELASLAMMIRIAINNSAPWAALYLIISFRYIVNIKINGKTTMQGQALRPSPFVYAMQ